MIKNYQRRHLRAPFKEPILYADGLYVLKASALNISEGGLLIDEIPKFPESDYVPLLIPIPQLQLLKNFSLLKLQTFSKELFPKQIIRVRAKMVRRHELTQNLDNIFKSKIGLEFVRISPVEQNMIEQYIKTFAANLIHLQTLIDSFNTDDETRQRVRILAKTLDYPETEKIAQLRAIVTKDYQSLQWT